MSFNHGLPVRFVSVSFTTESLGGKYPKLGEETYDSDGNKYVYIYNDCNSQISPGYGVAVQSGVSTPYSCTLSTVTSADLLVGVVKHSTITTGSYGYVVTRGVVNVEMLATSGSVATNSPIEIGANGAFAPVSNTTGNKAGIKGKSLAAIVSGASGSAYISVY